MWKLVGLTIAMVHFLGCSKSGTETSLSTSTIPPIAPCPGAIQCWGDFVVTDGASFVELENCDTITGNLSLEPDSAFTQDLEPLECLREVGGDLTITNHEGELDGLLRLEVVGGDFTIINSIATNYEVVSRLNSVGGSFTVSSSAGSIVGFPSLATVGEDFTIYADSANRISGFGTLYNIGGIFDVSSATSYGIPVMTTISGFDNLVSVEKSFFISSSFKGVDGFSTVEVLEGFSNLSHIGEDLRFGGAPLISFELPALITVGGSLIAEAPKLQNFGMLSLNSVGGNVSLIGYGDGKVTSINGLSNLNEVGGSFGVSDYDYLIDIDGFQGLSSADSVGIRSNYRLINLDGLMNLSSVNTVYISTNSSLISMTGLSGISSISRFEVSGNKALTSLNSLSSSISWTGNYSQVQISDNEALCESAVDDWLSLIESWGVPSKFYVVTENNADC